MPSRIFTRTQVLESLSDASARQEQEAVPDFIYYFLRDVFYAVDGDGDGYVTAEAVGRAIPSLLPTRVSLVSSLPGSPVSYQPSHFLHSSNNDDVRAHLMTPGVRHTWCSSSPFLAPTSPAVANRPLDLCGVMQTFWPTVSDKMARLVGDTWSQQSSGSESGSDCDARSSISSNSSHHHHRPVTFSPSPFRGVSLSPPRASAPHHEAAERDESSTACTSSSCANTSHSNLQGCTDVAPEQQRLYYETVRQLWPAAVHDSPLNSSRHCSSLVSRGSPLFPPPKRLLSDATVAELQQCFAYLDSNDSGFIDEDEVAAALHSLVSRATSEVEDASICRRDLQDLARAMLRLAVASTTRAAGGNVSVTAIATQGAAGPSPPASSPLCISLPVFVRSFQCDSGAFPADLVAWCASCNAYARRAQVVSGALTVAAPLHQLAVSLQWMSPLECAVVQDALARYAAEVSACLTAMKEEAKGEKKTRSQGGQRRGLSQRSSVNTHEAKKPVGGQRSQASAETSATPADQIERECCASVAEWCDHLRSLPVPPCVGDGEPAAAVLPVAVLEASLLHDLRGSLFPAAFDFSMAAGAAAEDVLWAHVQAVCSLARRIAAVEGQPASPASCGEIASFSSTTCVDVALLAEVISCDPRCLGLDVLVPLSTRLAAVVEFAQRLPRRVVAEAVKMTSDHLADSIPSASVDGKADSHGNSIFLSPALTRLTDLRRRLMALSPFLARLLTGATRFASGALVLHDCLAVLATQVLTVPPLRLPGVGWQLIEKRPAPPQHLQTTPAASPCAVLCASLRESPVLLKASRGWLRYACRRLLPQERKDVMTALRLNTKAKLYGLARAVSASVVGEIRHTPAILESAASDHYAVFFAHVCASHWTCRVDLTVAAHVALLLLASALTAQTAQGEVADESQWWCDVEAGLVEWGKTRHTLDDADSAARCSSSSSSSFWNEWAMAAVCSTAAEIGARGCKAISAALCHLRSETDTFSHCVIVREESLVAALAPVIKGESLWATQEAGEAQARLVYTLVGCCPRCSDGGVDVTLLLQRWLEAYPLPLSVSHLSLACPVTEVESMYYTLKRLAASEASERRRSETPSPSRGTSLRRPEAGTASREPEAAAAMVVTGITPVCLGELLENDAVLAVLYAVSPSESLGVWSGSLCYLERVLRPVLLSPTGVRVSLRKLHDGNIADSSAVVVSAAVDNPTTSARPLAAVDFTSLRPSYASAAQEMLVAMAVPPAVQHAVSRLFHLVEAANGVSGAVTEDQLRAYRPHVPAAARYGWHRFVTMLCATTMATSAMSATGGLSAGVLHSHYWRRHGSLTAQSAAVEEQGSESSVATQRTDDVAATYSCAAMLARVGELRACVQAQLLEERRESSGAATVGAAADREASASLAAGTAQWWAAYVEVLCRSYSALSW